MLVLTLSPDQEPEGYLLFGSETNNVSSWG